MSERTVSTSNDSGFALSCPLCGAENEVWEYDDGSHEHACDECSAPLTLNVSTTVNYRLVGKIPEGPKLRVGEYAGIPGYVVVNPSWPDADAPYMEIADDLCDECDGDGKSGRDRDEDCSACHGTGLYQYQPAPESGPERAPR